MLLCRCLHVARVTHKKQKKEISEIFNLYDRYFPLVRINPISDSDRIRSISKKKKKKADERKNIDNYESLKNKEEMITLIKYS